MIQDTQMEAYLSILDKLPTARKKVLQVIVDMGGATSQEVATFLGWPINRVSGRITELAENEQIINSGIRRENPESKKSNIVWEDVVFPEGLPRKKNENLQLPAQDIDRCESCGRFKLWPGQSVYGVCFLESSKGAPKKKSFHCYGYEARK